MRKIERKDFKRGEIYTKTALGIWRKLECRTNFYVVQYTYTVLWTVKRVVNMDWTLLGVHEKGGQ